jgi:hypothetical protein
MANWQHKIELNQILKQASENHDLSREEEDCPAEVKTAIAAEVEKAAPLAHFGKLIRNAKSIAKVNRLLQQVYNEADYSKVWCGG